VLQCLPHQRVFAGPPIRWGLLAFLIISSGAQARGALEPFLNLLWALVAFGAFVYWIAKRKRRVHTLGFINLVFILSLPLPVISANDNLAQLHLINENKTAQSIDASVRKNYQLLNRFSH